jgi:hypothetical protein
VPRVVAAIAVAAFAGCALPGETGEVARPHSSAPSPVADAAPAIDYERRREAGVLVDAGFEGGAPLEPTAPVLDVGSTAAAIDQWPRLVPGVQLRGTTSYDRNGGNDDGFGGTYSALYVDARGENVIFDAEGPGVLRTLWFTSAVDGDSPLALGKVGGCR